MFGWFFKKNRTEIPEKIYRLTADQSRNPVFFTQYGFHDTVMGRYDSLVLHMFLISNRLARAEHEYCRNLNQEVYDSFVANLDIALREMGVGDPTVPKRKKKFVRSYFGTIEDFYSVMGNEVSPQLVEKVAQRFFADLPQEEALNAARKLATYMTHAHAALHGTTDEDLLAGNLQWPAPENSL